ncbi:Heterogeneous nuclear ribonucleoprotein 1 [Quillaja saponaria]|uniref:Heterogeneous nuclear ribonucleoprotein 1 n=1 Tax=Quillaja saponaria TaxID=32244 RepID=A0AAD7Q4H8_QUISA|nr:Heterogeneous nuclear ribonucleoprotein 1 [Quillaja saponaria]KAJ7974630.1 Heterogeneous nuclear ribonucleoprotein 1 [Quillaja saponaria]
MSLVLLDVAPTLSQTGKKNSVYNNGWNPGYNFFFFFYFRALLSTTFHSNSQVRKPWTHLGNGPAIDRETNDVNVQSFNHREEEEEEQEDKSQPHTGDGASPGKIFIGGLARETTIAQFIKHFGKYGEITDSVIMKDRKTGQPRGFGFITYADSSVVDNVIQETHTINGKQVEIKRTIPRGAAGSRDFKTKKIFVGGIPATVDEDELRDFFSSYGDIREQQIMRDHSTNRSRGFGFITFDSEEAVDDLLSKGNKIEFAGTQVEIKKAEPKKPNPPLAPSKRYNDSRLQFGGGYGDAYEGYGSSFGGAYGSRGGAYGGRSGAYGGRGGAYGGYGGGEFGGYGGYTGPVGPYRADPSLGFAGRYGGGFSRGYDLGGYSGPGESYGGYGGAGASGGTYGRSYDASLGGGYEGGSGGSFYGSRGGYGGAGTGRYHPYGR